MSVFCNVTECGLYTRRAIEILYSTVDRLRSPAARSDRAQPRFTNPHSVTGRRLFFSHGGATAAVSHFGSPHAPKYSSPTTYAPVRASLSYATLRKAAGRQRIDVSRVMPTVRSVHARLGAFYRSYRRRSPESMFCRLNDLIESWPFHCRYGFVWKLHCTLLICLLLKLKFYENAGFICELANENFLASRQRTAYNDPRWRLQLPGALGGRPSRSPVRRPLHR
jgi:hypothetical protein